MARDGSRNILHNSESFSMMHVSMDIWTLSKWENGVIYGMKLLFLFERVYEVAFFRISEVFFNTSCDFTKGTTLC